MRRLALPALLVPLLLATLPAAADDPDEVAFRFADTRITESSGLVDTGEAMFTVNDSGNDPVVFRLDPSTGATTGEASFADAAVDVEALAPAGDDEVWVGDIGDNRRTRETVAVFRVPVPEGDTRVEAPRYELAYPDGAHDAETLLATSAGDLLVVTKDLSQGGVYRLDGPPSTERVNRLTKVATVGPYLTDGSLMPDERHVLLRNYGQISLYTFPDFDYLGVMSAPKQPQGEGLSVGPQGRVRLSSEGLHQPVLEVELSAALQRQLEPDPTTESSPSVVNAQPASEQSDAADRPGLSLEVHLALAAALLLAAAGAVVVLRRRG